MKEEAEGLRKKLERMEKTKEELVNVELEKQVWYNNTNSADKDTTMQHNMHSLAQTQSFATANQK